MMQELYFIDYKFLIYCKKIKKPSRGYRQGIKMIKIIFKTAISYLLAFNVSYPANTSLIAFISFVDKFLVFSYLPDNLILEDFPKWIFQYYACIKK